MNQQIWSFIRQQLIRVVLLIFAVSVVSFLLLVISPIDPIDAYFSGLSVTEEQKAAMAVFGQQTCYKVIGEFPSFTMNLLLMSLLRSSKKLFC